MRFLPAWILAVLFGVASCGGGAPPDGTVRVGHFPNVTHAHGVLGHHATRSGQGWFEERTGERVDWYVFNAGPSAMEALLTGSIDLAYVGPNPALNAFIKSGGESLRVVAGATEGGAALVVSERIREPADLKGRKVATPQFGNTQDVSCRAWLKAQGFEVTQTGGDVLVVPTANADQRALLESGEIDGAWTVEPWVSRLLDEVPGTRILVEEEDTVTTVLVASTEFLAHRPDVTARFVAAQRELTAWMAENPAQARERVLAELNAETSMKLSAEIIEQAWGRLRFTEEASAASFQEFARAAHEAGFLDEVPELSLIVGQP